LAVRRRHRKRKTGDPAVEAIVAGARFVAIVRHRFRRLDQQGLQHAPPMRKNRAYALTNISSS
jgi:hypothetical protein